MLTQPSGFFGSISVTFAKRGLRAFQIALQKQADAVIVPALPVVRIAEQSSGAGAGGVVRDDVADLTSSSASATMGRSGIFSSFADTPFSDAGE